MSEVSPSTNQSINQTFSTSSSAAAESVAPESAAANPVAQPSDQNRQPASNAKKEPEVVVPEYRLRCLRMPLAVYREVAAHLRQVDGVDTGLLSQTSSEFDYTKSQVGGLWISYQSGIGNASHQRTEEILAYYGDRFGTWEAIYPEK
ncbi:MAG: hypothetical protein WBA57_22020 [Elainellaceae cyanobacterium]